MSLFSSREWWATRLGSGEEFDGGCLLVANIDNDPSGAVKIVTGSLQGVLRVHLPHQRDYCVEDTLLEAELGSAILQLAAGNLMGGAALCLAVLHPRQLAVYSLQAMGSAYLQLVKLYEHHLERSAANMALGPFGGATGIDHVVVQSFDGQLAFFEAEVRAFARQLPGHLLPGPLAYVRASDSFVTSTAGLELVCYRHAALAAASSGDDGQQAGSAVGKRMQEDWRVVLGEAAHHIHVCSLATSSCDAPPPAAGGPGSLLVLTEHSVFVLSLHGQLLLQRRLDYPPACAWPFPGGEPGLSRSSSSADRAGGGAPAAAAAAADSLLLATHAQALLLYRGPKLAWAARLELLPVALRVSSFGGTRGMIVALDDTGRLAVLYLGTQPPRSAPALSEARPLDYQAMDAERRALLARISAAGADGLDVAAAAAKAASAGAGAPPLALRAQVPSRLDHVPGSSLSGGFGGIGDGAAAADGARHLTVTLLLSNTTRQPLRDVAISVLLPQPLQAPQQLLLLPEVPPAPQQPAPGRSRPAAAAGQPVAVSLVLQAPGGGVPASNTAQVVACFKQADGQAGVAQLALQLPMCLFCQVVPPVRSAAYKLTLTTNRDAQQLVALFGDMLVQASPVHAEALSRATQGANTLSYAFGSGGSSSGSDSDSAVVSILVSKNAGRYRLQSDCFEAMWLVLQELIQRLTAHFASPGQKEQALPQQQQQEQQQQQPLAISLDEELPLQDMFELVERHFGARGALAAVEGQLEQQETAFRSIQKRLLLRYKDKNAAPLNQLDVLMEETYEAIMQLADKMEAAQAQLAEAAQALGAGVQLLLLLARLKFGLSLEEAALLASCLSPVVQEGAEVGWEEHTEAAMAQLLRSVLARSAKEGAASNSLPACGSSSSSSCCCGAGAAEPAGRSGGCRRCAGSEPAAPLAPAADTARLRKHMALVFQRLAKGMRLVPQAAA